jgi:hypothetical protein
MSEKKELKFEIMWLPVDSLTPYVNNTKKHPTEQVDKIAQQIAKYGFDQPITVDKDKVIITGHGRREAAMRLGLKTVPVIIRDDLNDHDVMAKRIADNRVAQSDWDDEMLAFEVGTLFRNDYDLQYTGFEDDEIQKLLDLQEGSISTEGLGGSGNPGDGEEKQYIVSVECENEDQMASLYQELKERGLKCSLIS